jgi:hypothetical protein
MTRSAMSRSGESLALSARAGIETFRNRAFYGGNPRPPRREQQTIQHEASCAVILTEIDTVVVDESWLKRESGKLETPHQGLSALVDREVEIIGAALAESHGRISGPSGAGAKPGIRRQALESKIRRPRLDKCRRKPATSK